MLFNYSIHLENTTPNHDLIWKLYNNHEKVVSSKADQSTKERTKELGKSRLWPN